MIFECAQCTSDIEPVEFATMADLMAHNKGGHLSRPVKTIPPAPVEKKPVTPSATEIAVQPAQMPEMVKIEPVPIELKYQYLGTCRDCNRGVDTITVSMGDKDTMIAYCVSCHKQLSTRVVIPLSKQGGDEDGTTSTPHDSGVQKKR